VSVLGLTYSPDAHAVNQEIRDELKQTYRETDPEDTETMEKVDQLDELLNDPEIRQLIHERLDDE
jgi:hypothetical protein